MNKSIAKCLSVLPKEIENEIMSFLIPSTNKIIFRKPPRKFGNTSISEKYENAYIDNQLVENEKGLYLSRIPKKNGKHRYYITHEDVDVMHVEHGDSWREIYWYDYSSKYAGKSIDGALIKLFL